MTSEWLSSNNVKTGYAADGSLLGLYGWRRRCLLFTLTILLILVTINLALSLWMLKVLNFSRVRSCLAGFFRICTTLYS